MDSRRRLGGTRKSSSGQAPVLAALLFLLLVPTTVILAQNATLNITGDMLANISLPEVNATNITLPVNTTPPNTTLPVNTTLPDNDTNTSFSENITLPFNISVPENETLPDTNTTEFINESNITEPDNTPSVNITIPEEPEGPVLEIALDIPGRADRNQEFQVSAVVTNTGDTEANGVELEWVLPGGFLITQGSGTQTCDIPSGAACSSTLTVAASLSSMLGEQDIKILVRYHD